MVRNGNEKKISNKIFYMGNPIWYETDMVRNGFSHGTKWMIRNGHGTKRLATVFIGKVLICLRS